MLRGRKLHAPRGSFRVIADGRWLSRSFDRLHVRGRHWAPLRECDTSSHVYYRACALGLSECEASCATSVGPW